MQRASMPLERFIACAMTDSTETASSVTARDLSACLSFQSLQLFTHACFLCASHLYNFPFRLLSDGTNGHPSVCLSVVFL